MFNRNQSICYVSKMCVCVLVDNIELVLVEEEKRSNNKQIHFCLGENELLEKDWTVLCELITAEFAINLLFYVS